MRRFRLLNCLYAHLTGYFWRACPLCGEMFGGHETGGAFYEHGTRISRSGKLVCWRHPGDYVSSHAPPEMYRTSLDEVIDP